MDIKHIRTGLWAATLALGSVLAQPTESDWVARRNALGTSDAYRILVDKVLMASTGWIMQPEHVAEIRAAGFNVVVPRTGADDDARVRRAATMARDHGLFYMPWIRGTYIAKGGPDQRATAANGQTNQLASPNGGELWDYWHDRILFYAELSRENPAVMGVFLDFENYDKVKIGGGMCYTLSYDAPILRRFAAGQGLQIPNPLPADRGAWLRELGKADAFRDFQVNSWRERCRELRRLVDAINPLFQFVVYPASHSLFIQEAVWREWHTAKAPLIMAEVDTYWRTETELDDALAKNRGILQKRRGELDAVDPTIRYMAGLDPVVSGANPEFEGKSAVMGVEVTNGYWVFYEGPAYTKEDHGDYFAWFRRANDGIIEGDYSLWQQPAETPNPLVEDVARSARKLAGHDLVPFSDDPLPAGELRRVFTHRPRAQYQVLLAKGEHLSGELTALQHAHITSGSLAVVVTPSGKILGSVTAEIGVPGAIEMVAPEDGVYAIAITSGRAKGRLRLDNRYVCIAGPRVTLVGDQTSAYLAPKAGAAAIDLNVISYVPGEHVQVTLRTPDGTVAVDGNTRDECPFKVHGVANGREAWRLDLTKAIEDIYVDFGETCEPRMATHPGRLLVAP
ncbi:MAG: hypothetical protein HN742_36125 [Lentisphaerae bacterium]|jgi:hypothetical protein|nr:hypothetical protein [Lentisphaerota bacterium]MBT4817151.1 hypothetical protein [Lentisphaerota bacterium]MBT5604830.1 hypothetical protein [Lentisphaerota bacterium]MBT7056093.1 hypothetical protein [Lentisphaerota bacterium]MBT7847354.1 hypothetical protein [Lentisphaerota bacterium]